MDTHDRFCVVDAGITCRASQGLIMNKAISIPVGSGELIDKITILQIKAARIQRAEQLQNVRQELELLIAIRDRELVEMDELQGLQKELLDINTRLWEVEDEIRILEKQGIFNDRFIQLARSVYQYNDRRAGIKKQINLLTGSGIIEEKSYA